MRLKNVRKSAFAIGAIALMFGTVACGDDTAETTSCDLESIEAELKEARAELREAKEDTPEEVSAQDKVDDLKEEKTACLEQQDSASQASTTKPNRATTTTTTTTETEEVTLDDIESIEAQAAEDLTVTFEDLIPARARCEDDKFLDYSLTEVREGEPGFRQWSTAVSIMFSTHVPEEMIDELIDENCGNPTVLDMVIKGLSRQHVYGFSVGESNPWQGEFWQIAEKEGLLAFLTKKSGEEGIFVTADYQQYAEMTNTLLLGYQNRGTLVLESVENWHLEGRNVEELPRAVLNPEQENMPVLVLEYTVKDGCPLVVFGFNTGDKRFEAFPTPSCEPTTPTTTPGTTTPTTTPGTTTPTTTPGTTTPTTTPGTTTPTTTPDTTPETTPDTTPTTTPGTTTPTTTPGTTTTTVCGNKCTSVHPTQPTLPPTTTAAPTTAPASTAPPVSTTPPSPTTAPPPTSTPMTGSTVPPVTVAGP